MFARGAEEGRFMTSVAGGSGCLADIAPLMSTLLGQAIPASSVGVLPVSDVYTW